MSNPASTSGNHHGLNESIAANLATTFPETPERPTPNSAKKRRQMPDLSRPTATPSHGAKMSAIFRDAASSLQASKSPPFEPSSNIKRPRLPLSQARSIKFGSTCHDDTLMSSSLHNSPKLSQYPGESCEPKWASSEVSRHGASACESRPTQTLVTKAGRATLATLGAATSGMCLDSTLRDSSPSLRLQIEEDGKETISSGFARPVIPTPHFVENPENVRYPMLETRRSLECSSFASSLGSDSEDLHSTHGVPLVLPFPHSDAREAPCSYINTWLDGVVDATTLGRSRSRTQGVSTEDLLKNDDPYSRSIAPNFSSPLRPRISPSELKQDFHAPSGAISNKENISPSKDSSSPTQSPTNHQKGTPSLVSKSKAKALHFAHPLTPQAHLSLPPKRKRARVKGVAISRAETEMPNVRRDFTIHEDKLADALAQLSPDVERHRKGKGPKRERCMSYWD